MGPSEFIEAATGNTLTSAGIERDTPAFREYLLDRFARIHKMIRCEHSEGEGSLVADAILQLEVAGPIVECGCFLGGFTAKLSIVCGYTARTLYVCDSFEGLPQPATHPEVYEFYECREDVIARFGSACHFRRGQYCGSLNQVKQNVARWGCIDVCEFRQGLFTDTLPTLGIEPALVLIDVDLIESARDCLRYLWPVLKGNRFFTHEAFNKTYMDGILDTNWWRENLDCQPPTVVGRAYGVNPAAGCTAYLLREQAG